MGLSKKRKLKSGLYSTSSEVLKELKMEGVKIASEILNWRRLTSIISENFQPGRTTKDYNNIVEMTIYLIPYSTTSFVIKRSKLFHDNLEVVTAAFRYFLIYTCVNSYIYIRDADFKPVAV
ncbi:DNA polymerase [Dirofilaria immitis]